MTPFDLEDVPHECTTAELCFAAVQENGEALQYVPEPLKTPELCLVAVRDYAMALEYVPEKLKTSELCLVAVLDTGKALRFVPEALKTPELCLLAVQNDGDALQFVPEKFKTQGVFLSAFTSAGGFNESVIEQAKDGDVFRRGKRVTTRPRGCFPVIWEEEPGGNLVVLDVFAQKKKIFPREEYKKALTCSKIHLLSDLEVWRASKNTSVKLFFTTVTIPTGCLSLWGEMSVS